MTPVPLAYLQVYTSRGKVYAYYRRGKRRVRITDVDGKPVVPGDAAFVAAYQRIHQTFEDQGRTERRPAAVGTLAHLIDHYRESADFKSKAPKTRKDYTGYLDLLKQNHGHLPIKTMPREFVLALRDKYANTPRKANYILQILRLLFSYAVDRSSTFGVTVNPAARPRRFKSGDGHRPWEESEVALFRARWPLGSWERIAFELALNTAQRGGDVLATTWGHVEGGAVRVHQQKTGAHLGLPVSRDLAAALDAWRQTRSGGEPDRESRILGTITVDRFRHRMAASYKAAKVSDVTTHGLRYTAATRVYELLGDWEGVAAITGHATMQMAMKYSAQRRAARLAIDCLDAATSEQNVRNEKNGNGPASV
ncbi:site-specific integrase [Roseospira visakhapatnamensis]|uniref:Integrase n=1 Tax=Roseospira visakhapatnamensis TaxID=390880 RepID=A0A7W6RGR8_9PROT|nr:tyrosine-type recombinase/integrase [Roseospira visakhapatnamensis]MBB4267691.1 integrase [Roseospira visakhapatnamensis]